MAAALRGRTVARGAGATGLRVAARGPLLSAMRAALPRGRGGSNGAPARRWKSTEVADASFLTEAEAALSRNPQLADTLVEHLSPEVRKTPPKRVMLPRLPESIAAHRDAASKPECV